MTTPAPGHVFISYVREDRGKVDQLVAVLEAAGLDVWLDRAALWPGQEWKLEIQKAIQSGALAFVACFSENSAAREKSYQFEELVLAADEYRQRPPGRPWLFPIRFEDVELPYYDLGAGRTLYSLQLSDVFGDGREAALVRLVTSVNKVLPPEEDMRHVMQAASVQPRSDAGNSANLPTQDVASEVKRLLRAQGTDIELDDWITRIVDATRRVLIDSSVYPSTTSATTTEGLVAEVVDRAKSYDEAMTPAVSALITGCAWSTDRDAATWTRAMRVLANSTPALGGTTMLLTLRRYPILLSIYAATLGAVARDNYRMVRAAVIDATTPDLPYNPQLRLPLVALANVWLPFDGDSISSSALAYSDTETYDSETIGLLSSGRLGKRHTPVSDHLFVYLRDSARPILMDDQEYEEAFNRTEVLLGLLTEDAKLNSSAYVHGASYGRYSWSEYRFGRANSSATPDRMRAEFDSAGGAWAPLQAGLFGGSAARATAAFDVFETGLDLVLRNRH